MFWLCTVFQRTGFGPHQHSRGGRDGNGGVGEGGAEVSFSKEKRGVSETPLRGPQARANPTTSLMAQAAAGLTSCPVVWLTPLGSTTKDTPKKRSSHVEVAVTAVGAAGSPWGVVHGVHGAASSPCQGSPAEELNGRQRIRVEPSRSQHGCVGSPPAPPSQPELPGDTGGAEASPRYPEIPLA